MSLWDSILTACLPCKKDDYQGVKVRMARYPIPSVAFDDGSVVKYLPEVLPGAHYDDTLEYTAEGVTFVLYVWPESNPTQYEREWYAAEITKLYTVWGKRKS